MLISERDHLKGPPNKKGGQTRKATDEERSESASTLGEKGRTESINE